MYGGGYINLDSLELVGKLTIRKVSKAAGGHRLVSTDSLLQNVIVFSMLMFTFILQLTFVGYADTENMSVVVTH